MSCSVTFENGLYFGPAKGLGCWFESKENVPIGTVRCIGGILFHAWMRNRKNVSWIPVDKSVNTPEGWKRFYAENIFR